MLETSTENHTAEALMAAFQRGAGVQPNWQLTPEFMEMLGKLVGTSISGAHGLLLNRAELKRNIHADATVVVVRNNNPLKFLPDSVAAKTQMLRKKMPGFMGPVEALEDAFADLSAHHVGMRPPSMTNTPGAASGGRQAEAQRTGHGPADGAQGGPVGQLPRQACGPGQGDCFRLQRYAGRRFPERL